MAYDIETIPGILKNMAMATPIGRAVSGIANTNFKPSATPWYMQDQTTGNSWVSQSKDGLALAAVNSAQPNTPAQKPKGAGIEYSMKTGKNGKVYGYNPETGLYYKGNQPGITGEAFAKLKPNKSHNKPVDTALYKNIVGKQLAVPAAAAAETTADTITLPNAPAMTAINAALGNNAQTRAVPQAAPIPAAEKEGLGWWARLTHKNQAEIDDSQRDMQSRIQSILGGDNKTVRGMYGKSYIEDNQ